MNHLCFPGFKGEKLRVIIYDKYARKYPYIIIIGLFKICIITVHAHAVGTSLFLPSPPSEGL